MSSVEFEGDNSSSNTYASHVILGEAQVPGMAKRLMSTGIVRSPKQAYFILVVIAVLCFALSAYFVYKAFSYGVPLF